MKNQKNFHLIGRTLACLLAVFIMAGSALPVSASSRSRSSTGTGQTVSSVFSGRDGLLAKAVAEQLTGGDVKAKVTDQQLQGVTKIVLDGESKFASWAGIGKLTGLTHFSARNTGLAGKLGDIEKLTKLQVLNLENTKVTGDLDKLEDMDKLTELVLGGSSPVNITGALEDLKDKKELVTLGLAGTKAGGKLADLKGLVKLQSLSLPANSSITGKLEDLAALTALQKLDCPAGKVTGALADLEKMPGLTALVLGGEVSGDIAQFAGKTGMTELVLFGAKVQGDIAALAGLTKLTRLDITGTAIGGDFGALAQMTGLTEFAADKTGVYGNLSVLSGLEKLQTVSLQDLVVTLPAIQFGSEAVVVPSAIRDGLGNPIAPASQPEGGSYADGAITWELPAVKQASGSLTYSFRYEGALRPQPEELADEQEAENSGADAVKQAVDRAGEQLGNLIDRVLGGSRNAENNSGGSSGSDSTAPAAGKIFYSGTVTQPYTRILSAAKEITSFALLEQVAEINQESGAITLAFPYGTDVRNLAPAMAHTGDQIAPAAEAPQDFSQPVEYTVVAEDGSARVYTVTVTVARNPAKDINAFVLNGQAGAIDQEGGTIAFSFPYGAQVDALQPAIEHTGASVSPAAGEAQDFTNPVQYTVTAEDGSTRAYTVTVTVAKNPAKKITGFYVNGQSGTISGQSITLTLPNGADVAQVRPVLAYVGETVNPPSGEPRDFSGPVQYSVTAEDGSVLDYTVNISVEPAPVTNTPPPSYRVLYNVNHGGLGTSQIDDQLGFEYNGTVTVIGTAPTRAGYTFAGWNTRADGGGTAYKAGDTFLIHYDTMLYAQWQVNTVASSTPPAAGSSPVSSSPSTASTAPASDTPASSSGDGAASVSAGDNSSSGANPAKGSWLIPVLIVSGVAIAAIAGIVYYILRQRNKAKEEEFEDEDWS